MTETPVTTLKEQLENYTPEEQARINQRTEELKSQHHTLIEFRKALVCAREIIAAGGDARPAHGPIPQDPVETILGLLHQCVEAMGGRYSLIVELPGRAPLALTDFEVADDEFHERGAVYHELTTLKDDWLERASIPE